MRTLPLLLLLAILPGMVSAQQNPSPAQDKRSEGVVKRGDHVMGFSHEATTHHFRLFSDGGEIAVTANDPKDKASIDQIRTHLGHIAQMFASGNGKQTGATRRHRRRRRGQYADDGLQKSPNDAPAKKKAKALPC